MKQQSPARSTNFIFIVGDDRSATYSVQNAATPDVTLGETPFSARPKDLFIPSNKLETSPIIVQFLLDEDLSQWISMYKWILTLKNSNSAYLPDLTKTCELTSLDEQNQPMHRFIYGDCFPTNISTVQYTVQGDSLALTFDVTFRYNSFKIITRDNETIGDDYTGN